MYSFYPQTVILSWGAILCICTSFLGWQRRDKPGGRAFIGLMSACAVWTTAAAVESAVVGVAAKIFWSKMEYVGLVFIGSFLFFFALSYTHQTRLIRRGMYAFLLLMPVVALLLVWTNEWHHAQWTGFSPGPQGMNVLVYHRGPVFWFISAYTYTLTLFGYGVFANACRSADRSIRRQYVVFMLSGVFPLASGVVYLAGQEWVGGMDVSAMGFSFAGLMIAWDFSRFQLLDLVPIGREVLVERMPDGMIVFDESGRQVDINPAARHMLDLEESPVTLQNLQARFPALAGDAGDGGGVQTEATLQTSSGQLDVSIRRVPLYGLHGKLRGNLCVLGDLSARVAAERERERVIAELSQALSQIKTLQDLLPICCACKKVRNDHGYWQQIESYIREHAGVEFSHSLCPDCAKKLYGSSDVGDAKPGFFV